MLAERVDGVPSQTTADARRPGLRNPLDATRRVRAVLFDVDGTLYRQPRLRAFMGLELATLALRRPLQAPVSWRVLSEFRKAQEVLRSGLDRCDATGQLAVAARRTGLSVDQVEAIVAEWMLERPLKYLPRCRAEGLLGLLDFLRDRQIRMGVFSDYPSQSKLEALGIGGRFSLVLCSTDSEIGVFKPHPRGFLFASSRWQLDPSEVLVVGDRLDADAAGAAAAGMPCVIIGRPTPRESGEFVSFVSLERLRDALDDDHSR
jgi:HAD superfamily hydrolase (TIGR01549 family)